METIYCDRCGPNEQVGNIQICDLCKDHFCENHSPLLLIYSGTIICDICVPRCKRCHIKLPISLDCEECNGLCKECLTTTECLECDRCYDCGKWLKANNCISCYRNFCNNCLRVSCGNCRNVCKICYPDRKIRCNDCNRDLCRYCEINFDEELHSYSSNEGDEVVYGCNKCGGNYDVFNLLCRDEKYDEVININIKDNWFGLGSMYDKEIFQYNVCKMYNYVLPIIRSQQEYIEHLENRPPELGGPNYESAKKHFTNLSSKT